MQQWWTHPQQYINIYLNSRFGKPSQPLNVQWLDSLEDIESKLADNGWTRHPTKLTIKTAVQRMHPKKPEGKLPLLPKLYHNQEPALLMTKTSSTGKPLVIRLWRADVKIINSNYPLWIGSANQIIPGHHWLTRHHEQKTYISEAKKILNINQQQQSNIITIAPKQIPLKLQQLHWNGNILLIRAQP